MRHDKRQDKKHDMKQAMSNRTRKYNTIQLQYNVEDKDL